MSARLLIIKFYFKVLIISIPELALEFQLFGRGADQ
jgi:hypothetical protein